MDRENTIQISFETGTLKPSPLEVHEFIHDKFKLSVDEIAAIQIPTTMKCVFLKLVRPGKMRKILEENTGEVNFYYSSGAVTQVKLSDGN